MNDKGTSYVHSERITSANTIHLHHLIIFIYCISIFPALNNENTRRTHATTGYTCGGTGTYSSFRVPVHLRHSVVDK